MNSKEQTDKILADPAASFWLKSALKESWVRDPADALMDAEILTELLQKRWDEVYVNPIPGWDKIEGGTEEGQILANRIAENLRGEAPWTRI